MPRRAQHFGHRSGLDDRAAVHHAEIVAKLREKYPEIGEKPDARTVFVKLRELRNRW